MLDLRFTRAQMPACFSSSVEAGGMSKTPARGKADCHVWATRRPLRPFTDADPPTRVENPLLGARRPRVYHCSTQLVLPACRPLASSSFTAGHGSHQLQPRNDCALQEPHALMPSLRPSSRSSWPAKTVFPKATTKCH